MTTIMILTFIASTIAAMPVISICYDDNNSEGQNKRGMSNDPVKYYSHDELEFRLCDLTREL